MKYSAWWLLSIAALVTACAGVPREGDDSSLERHLAYAGEPVDRFYFPQRIRGWSPVNREHLVVRTETDKAYLLAVEPGCIGLQDTRSIALTSQFGRTDVTSGFDEIRLEHDRCRIVEIRPLDYERMREEQRIDANEIRQATLDGK